MADLWLELEGARALALLKLITNNIVDSIDPDHGRIAKQLQQVAVAIRKMKDVLMSLTKLVTPDTFYNQISPWLLGPELDPLGRIWQWEGSEEVDGSAELLTKTSSPTAGQSPTVPCIDAYLGLEEDDSKRNFLDRVSVYMIQPHQTYLQHLRSNGRPIRSFVENISKTQGATSAVVTAYNAAVMAMKSFRDYHLVIVSKYIILPASRQAARSENGGTGAVTSQDPASGRDQLIDLDVSKDEKPGQAKMLMSFLKGFRDQTERTYIG
jgi:indoleamine 2,3-dioxygenase